MSYQDDLIRATGEYHKKLQKLSEPLHRLMGTHYFGYVSVDANLKFTSLHNNLQWGDYCVEASLFENCPCMVLPEKMGSGVALYESYQNDEFIDSVLKASVEQFDIAHELVVVQSTGTSYEVFSVGASQENKQWQRSMTNKINYFYKFIEYFKREAQPILQASQEYQVDLSAIKGSSYLTQTPLIDINDAKDREKFLKKIS